MILKEKRHICKCPKCEKHHTPKKSFIWIGRGTPRKYCESCRYEFYFNDDLNEVVENPVHI